MLLADIHIGSVQHVRRACYSLTSLPARWSVREHSTGGTGEVGAVQRTGFKGGRQRRTHSDYLRRLKLPSVPVRLHGRLSQPICRGR